TATRHAVATGAEGLGRMAKAKSIGWIIYIVGLVIWLFGYLSTGHAATFDWDVYTPWWIPAVAHEEVELINCGQTVCSCKIEDALAIQGSERVGHHEDGVRLLTCHRCKCLFEIVWFAHAERLDSDAHDFGCCFGGLVAQRHAQIGGIPKH